MREPLPGRDTVFVVRGSHSIRIACTISFAFAPGCLRQNVRTRCW